MSKYKILWVIPLFFIISICGVLYFQKNIPNEMSRFEIAYINNHLIIPDSQEIIEKGYPKNESGETYGPDLSDYVGSVPDLILAESEEGIKEDRQGFYYIIVTYITTLFTGWSDKDCRTDTQNKIISQEKEESHDTQSITLCRYGGTNRKHYSGG